MLNVRVIPDLQTENGRCFRGKKITDGVYMEASGGRSGRRSERCNDQE